MSSVFLFEWPFLAIHRQVLWIHFSKGLKLDHFKPCVDSVLCGWFPSMTVSNINFVKQIAKVIPE